MFKVSVIFIALLYTSAAAAQQSTADKSTISLANPIEDIISAAAIPMELAGTLILDSANYHKVVVTGVEPIKQNQVIEVVAQGILAHEHIQGVAKEIITTGVVNEEDRTIIITDHALPVKPKQ